MKRSVSVIVENTKKEILLHLRDNKPTIPCPNQWTIPGGHVEEGETAKEGALRELKEEMELVPKKIKFLFEYPWEESRKYFYYVHQNLDIKKVKLHEGQKVAFFTTDDACKMKLAFQDHELLKDFLFIRNQVSRIEHITEEEAIALLKRHIPDEKLFHIILNHTKTVRDIALEHAKLIKGIDIQFVRTAALLHDIGRPGFPPRSPEAYKHGVVGAKILRAEGLPKHAFVAERHLGFGISKEDIKNQKLDIPFKEYIPLSPEEKIVCYADKFAAGDRRITEQDIRKRFNEELGIESIRQFDKLIKEIESLKQKSKAKTKD